MYAQLFLGLLWIILGTVTYFKRKPGLLLSATITTNIFEKDLPSYLKKISKVQIFFGVFVIIMGQIEYRMNPEFWIFITSYIVVGSVRSEEHTSELQSRFDIVCRLLLAKKRGTILWSCNL